MKKLLLLIALLFLAAVTFTTAYADTVQIGTGTTTSSYFPIYGLYGYNYSQQIYTQAEINRAGTISKIRFYYVSGTITNSKDWVIYMGHTTKTVFSSTTDWEPLANLTQVFAGDVSSMVPLANNWMEITLTTPFNYNNTNNLIIAVDENTSGYASMSWGAFASGANRGISYYNDTTNPNPASPPTANYGPNATISRIQLVFPNSAAPLAPTLVSPTNGGYAVSGDKLYWTPAATGSDATSYDVYFGTSGTPPLVGDNQTGTNYTPTLAPGTTYYWNVVANNEIGSSPASNTWSLKTPTATQLVESFESTSFPPAGWANPGTWSRGTTYKYHGTAGAYKSGSTSASYVLSTPRLTITPTSTLNFWAAGSSTSTSILQVIYSSDRVTWTQIGSNITPTATYTMVNHNIDLSSLAGNNYYLGFRNGAGTGTNYIDLVIGPEITPEVPGVPALVAPANGGTYVSTTPTFSWTAPTTGGVPTGYKVYCDTNNPPTTQIADVTGLTYTHTTPLANNTLYYWSVKGYNAAGTSDAPTANGFTTVGVGYIAIGSGTSTQRQPFGIFFGYERSAAIYTQAQLGQYGLLDNVGWYCATSSTNAVPYKIYAKTTTDAGFTADTWANFSATATLLKEGTYTFSSVGWHMFSLDTPFTYASGNLIIVIETFYGGSGISSYPYFYYSTGASNSHEYWYADTTPPTGNGSLNTQLPNVLLHLDALPVNPVLSVAPTSWSFGLIPTNTTLTKQFTMTNTGGGTLTINSIVPSGSYYSITSNPAPVSLTTGQTANFTIQYAPTAPGTHNGTVTINDSRSVTNISLTGTAYAPATLPFTETWEAGQGAWQVVNGTQANQWYVGSVVAHEGSNSAFISNDSGVTNAYTITTTSVVHMYQDITFTPGDYEYNLSFWHKTQGESTWDGLKVFLVDTSVTPEAGTQLTTGQIGNTWYNLVADWTNVVIPISSSFAGTTKRLVFSWRNDDSVGAMPPTALDDINLTAYELAAPEAPVLVYPADNQTNLPKGGFNLSWTRSPTGSAPTAYIVHMGSSPETVYTEGYDWEVTTTTFNPVTSATNPMTFAYNSVWYWTVEAVNLLGGTPYEPPRRFTIEPDPAITALPYAQNFDGVTTPAFPSGWTAYKSYSSSSIYTSTTYYKSSPNAVYMYSSNTTETMRLISPQILVPISGIKLSFWLRAGGTGYTMKVGTVSALDGTGVFTQVATVSPATSGVFTQYTVSFAGYSGTDQYICFQHGVVGTYQSFYLDTVLFEALLANDLAATGISGINWGIVSNQLSYIISVKNNGTATQNSYTVKLMSQDTRTELASLLVNTPLASDATAVHTLNWTPTTAATYNLYGQVVLTGDQYAGNDNTAILPVAVFPVGTFLPQIGDINSTTTTNSVPINVYWKNSLCETIYLAHELQMTAGTINAIVFQNNFTQELTKPIKIWMKTTTATSLETAYLGFDGYTLVFEGDVHFPLGVNFVVIPLTTPFEYSGGNLAVRTYRVWEDAYWNSSNVFYYTASPEYPNRSRYYYADQTSAFDPVLLLDYLGVAFTGTATNYIPNTAFIVYPASPVTSLTAPVVSIANVGTNAVLTWPAVSGAYSYKVYASNDPYSFVGDPVATVHTNSYTVAGVTKKFFKVVAISTYRNGDAGLTLDPALLKWDNSKAISEPAVGKTENKD